MDVRPDALCRVDDIFGCDGEIGWERLRRGVHIPSHQSYGCRDARDHTGQQVPLLDFGGHCWSCLQPESWAAMACEMRPCNRSSSFRVAPSKTRRCHADRCLKKQASPRRWESSSRPVYFRVLSRECQYAIDACSTAQVA